VATTYVVTGGAGFIGSHIAEHLLRDGHAVHVIDNLLTGKRANIEHLESLNGDFTYHEQSILDTEAITQIFQGAEIVFHQAALASVPRSVKNPLATHEHCVTGTLSVLVAARDAGVRRVVYAASSSAYGDAAEQIKVETLPNDPISPYGAAKLMGEQYCRTFWHTYQLETVALRYFNVFGPRQDPTSQYAAVIPKFITRMLNDQPPIIYGDGHQSRDFTYIDNVVYGNLLAASAPDAIGEVMNMATGGNVSLLALVDKLNTILGTEFAPQHDPPRAGDILHSQAGIDKARELLDFAPVVDFDEGLKRTVAWYRQQ
jgi:UDP-glucose 4-epimerase